MQLHNSFTYSELAVDVHAVDHSNVKIVAFGHIYNLLEFPDILDAFILKVIEEQPDYVFVLGDIVFNNSDEE